MHFLCCILPAGLALVNLVLGTDYSLSLELLDHKTEDVILILSGAALVAALCFHFREPAGRRDGFVWWAATLWIFSLWAHLAH